MATPHKHQLYGHLPPITKTIQVRRTRHAGHCWRSRDELIRDVTLMDPPQHGRAKQDDQHEHTFSSYVRITGCCPEDLPRAMNDREECERGSGISVLPARYDDIIIISFFSWKSNLRTKKIIDEILKCRSLNFKNISKKTPENFY